MTIVIHNSMIHVYKCHVPLHETNDFHPLTIESTRTSEYISQYLRWWLHNFWNATRPPPLRGGGQNPQSLSFVLRAITKQNQNTQKKVPTTQPNPQYSAKNNVSIHMIEAFMPPPFIITGLNHITNKWILLLLLSLIMVVFVLFSLNN